MKRSICFALLGVMTTVALRRQGAIREKEDAMEASATVEAIDPSRACWCSMVSRDPR